MTSRLLPTLVFSVAALASAGSFAQDSQSFPEPTAPVSSTTRAEVRADLQQARQQAYGLIGDNNFGSIAAAPAPASTQPMARMSTAQQHSAISGGDNAFPG